MSVLRKALYLCLAAMAVVCSIAVLATPAAAEDKNAIDTPKPVLAATPPMGWNSWNHFNCGIDEGKIRAQADAHGVAA